MAISTESLKQNELFATLAPHLLERVAAIMGEETFEPGTYVFKEGDPGDKLYCMVKGEIIIQHTLPNGSEEALAVVKKGNYFGEMSILDDQTSQRSADAKVLVTSVCYTIARDDFEQLLFVNKDLAHDLLWIFVRTMCARLRANNDKMKAIMALTSGGFG